MVKIALDLDGVITNIGQGVKDASDATEEEISKALFNSHGYGPLDSVFGSVLFWRNLKPIQESWHKVNQWYYSGHDIYFITARRSEESISQISKWLDVWQIGYTDYIVCDMMHKHEILSEIQADVFVDDNPIEISKCLSAIDDRIKSKMTIMAFKCWYNSHLIDEYNVPYISSLEEIKIG